MCTMYSTQNWSSCLKTKLPVLWSVDKGIIKSFKNYFRQFLFLKITEVNEHLRRQCSGFSGLEVVCWPLVPKVAGSNPAEAVWFLRGKKILSTPSFGGEVKLSVPCHRFVACKRSLKCNMEVDILGKNYQLCFLPMQFNLLLLGVSRVARMRRRTGGQSGNV